MQLGIDKLLGNKGYAAAFPLHDGPHDPDHVEDRIGNRNKLWLHWARFGKWYKRQPLDLVRAYFGERIGLGPREVRLQSLTLNLFRLLFRLAWFLHVLAHRPSHHRTHCIFLLSQQAH